MWNPILKASLFASLVTFTPYIFADNAADEFYVWADVVDVTPIVTRRMNALQRQTAGSSKGKGIEAIMIFIPVTTAGPMAMYYRRFSAVYWAASSRTLVWRDKEPGTSEVRITQPTE